MYAAHWVEDRRQGQVPEHPCDGPFPTDLKN